MRDQPSHQFIYIPHFSFVQVHGSRIPPIEVELGQTFPSKRPRNRALSSLLGLPGLGIGGQR